MVRCIATGKECVKDIKCEDCPIYLHDIQRQEWEDKGDPFNQE